MGEIRSVRCSACKAEWMCRMGSGFLHGKKENIVAAFLEQERAEVAAWIEKSEIPAYDFSFRLAVCAHCHSVVSVPVLGIIGEDEPYVGLCSKCGKETQNLCGEEQSVEEWSEKTVCPVCKSKKLESREIGYWD